MPDMLRMPAGEVGDPIALLVLVKADNGSLHDSILSKKTLCA